MVSSCGIGVESGYDVIKGAQSAQFPVLSRKVL